YKCCSCNPTIRRSISISCKSHGVFERSLSSSIRKWPKTSRIKQKIHSRDGSFSWWFSKVPTRNGSFNSKHQQPKQNLRWYVVCNETRLRFVEETILLT